MSCTAGCQSCLAQQAVSRVLHSRLSVVSCTAGCQSCLVCLQTLVHHSLSGMFGTFLTDSHQERQDMVNKLTYLETNIYLHQLPVFADGTGWYYSILDLGRNMQRNRQKISQSTLLQRSVPRVSVTVLLVAYRKSVSLS